MRARPTQGLLRLLDRYAAGPDVGDAVRAAAGVTKAHRDVGLERLPAGDTAELLLLTAAVRDAGLAPRVELIVPVDVLGPSAAETAVDRALEGGLGVALEGLPGPVTALAVRFPAARVVVPAAEPGAEERCRLLASAAVRLVQGRGTPAARAFVRCLNVLMSGDGRPAVAATDPRLVAIAGERAAWNDRPPESWEHVMPYGVRTDEQQRLTAAGYRVRVTVPWGPGAAAAPLRRLAGRP
ncbi:MAG: putative proline dehydrogenase [Frankiales bacterium]|nr:putative proline dehydrogenase [Frankiales bacterium]